MQMETQIQSEIKEKLLNDKIMKFAMNTERTTSTKVGKNKPPSTVKASFKRGVQNYKFEEIKEKRREAIERNERKVAKEQARIKEVEFIRTQ